MIIHGYSIGTHWIQTGMPTISHGFLLDTNDGYKNYPMEAAKSRQNPEVKFCKGYNFVTHTSLVRDFIGNQEKRKPTKAWLNNITS